MPEPDGHGPVPRSEALTQVREALAERGGVLAVVAMATVLGAALWIVAVDSGTGGSGEDAGDAVVIGAPVRGTSSVAAEGTRAWTVGLVDRTVRAIGDAGPGADRPVGAAGDSAVQLVARRGALWVALHRGGTGAVVRLDLDGRGTRVFGTGSLLPSRIAVTPRRIVVVGDPRVAAVPVAGGRGWSRPLPGAIDVATGYGSVWTVSRSGGGRSLVTRRDPTTGKVTGRRAAPAAATAIAVGLGAVWVANGCADGVLRVPVGPGPGTCTRVGRGPADVVVGAGAAWAADAAGRRIVQLAPTTGAIARTWATPGRPAALAATPDGIVALTRDGAVLRVPATVQG